MIKFIINTNNLYWAEISSVLLKCNESLPFKKTTDKQKKTAYTSAFFNLHFLISEVISLSELFL